MENYGFNWLDIAILAVIFISILISLLRGFIKEALSLATWGIAIWCGVKYNPLLESYLSQYISSKFALQAVGFFIIFIASLIIGSLVSYTFALMVKKTGLSGTDRVIGIVFGAARGVLVTSLVLLVVSYSSLTHELWWSDSKLIPHFKPIMAWLNEFVPIEAKRAEQIAKSDLDLNKILSSKEIIKHDTVNNLGLDTEQE